MDLDLDPFFQSEIFHVKKNLLNTPAEHFKKSKTSEVVTFLYKGWYLRVFVY